MMNSKKLNDLLRAFKSGDYDRLREVKNMVSEEDYQKAVQLFNQYGGMPENEVLNELAQLKESVPNYRELIDKIKPLLDEEQLSKLNKVVNYLDN